MQLPLECEWLVWIDPAPTDRVALAFEELHARLEKSWLKAHHLERRVMHLIERNEFMQTWGFLIVLGISILATFVFGWSKNE